MHFGALPNGRANAPEMCPQYFLVTLAEVNYNPAAPPHLEVYSIRNLLSNDSSGWNTARSLHNPLQDW